MNSNLDSTIKQKIEKIHQMVLSKIEPTKSAKIDLIDTILNLFRRTEEIIKEQQFGFDLEPILVGSTAKDTYLINPDIDLFIMFPTSVDVTELRALGLMLGKKIITDGEERYAEHPYISGTFEGFETDIVPCYKLSSITERMTAVDRTPFHTRFIVENLSVDQHTEVRLLKQFMKGVGVYGAEIQVQGFSGYLCEILILNYGTILDLLYSASNWPDELLIQVMGTASGKKQQQGYTSRSDLPNDLAIKFKDEPLIVIDPVDPKRNVASAVSIEKYRLFRIAAKEYIKKPRQEFFFPNKIEPLSLKELRKRFKNISGAVIGLELTKPDAISDVLYGQVRKCQRAIIKLFITEGFGIENADYFVSDKILFIFQSENAILSDVKTHTGPPEGHKNVNDFLHKWAGSSKAIDKPYLKDSRWFVDLKREYTTPDKLLNANLFELNLGKQINDEIKKSFKLYNNDELLKPGFELILTKFFEQKFPWEY